MDLINTMYRLLKRKLIGFKFVAERRNARMLRGYTEISLKDALKTGRDLKDAWNDPAVPAHQECFRDKELARYRKGFAVPVFDAITGIITRNIPISEDTKVLEVGCSSGYYSEVLSMKGIKCSYTGCDCSEAFIELARARYPALHWDVNNATELGYNDSEFNVVISGCCLQYMYEFERGVSEAARVSDSFVVFHRTPVVFNRGPIYYCRNAYGVKMLEIHFQEDLFVKLLKAHGLSVIDRVTIERFPFWNTDDTLEINTYLCKKY